MRSASRRRASRTVRASPITPTAARTLVEEIKTLTDKPVRYVVDTHFHFDHAHGNPIFGPEVEVIGHEFTREAILAGRSMQGSFINFTAGLPKQIEDLKTKVAAEANAEAKAKLEQQLKVSTAYQQALTELDTLKPTPPNVTLQRSMTIFRGSREIQLHFVGRGHTAGDVVVFLPKERVVATGDLLTAALSYMGDGFVTEWPDTLEELKKLEFDWVIPGHGEPYQGKSQLEHFEAYLRDFAAQVSALKKKGVAANEAAKQMDLTAHKANYPSIQAPGADPIAVKRAYEVLEAR